MSQPPSIYNRPGKADSGNVDDVVGQAAGLISPAAASLRNQKMESPSAKTAELNGTTEPDPDQNGTTESDPDKDELELVRAKTMHQMVDDLPDNRRILYLTNAQANLISGDFSIVQKMIDALQVPTDSQMVIRLLPTSGMSYSQNNGMIAGFQLLAREANGNPEKYAKLWKEKLAAMYELNPKDGIPCDIMPIPSFLGAPTSTITNIAGSPTAGRKPPTAGGRHPKTPTKDAAAPSPQTTPGQFHLGNEETEGEGQGPAYKEQAEAEWLIEAFMRDVLVPLAAETKAVIMGSAFKDDTLMMAFAKVSKAMATKYGSATKPPWTMFGFADAPSLCLASQCPNSVASTYFEQCTSWKKKFPRVLKARILAERKRMDPTNTNIAITEEDERMFLQSKDYIKYDLNPDIAIVAIVGGVEVANGAPLCLSSKPQRELEAKVTDILNNTRQAFGIASGHAKYNYLGFQRMVKWMHMDMPVLVLDVRNRTPHKIEHPNFGENLVQDPNEEQREFEKRLEIDAIQKVDRLKELFEELKQNDGHFQNLMHQNFKVDFLELCRLAHFHSVLFPKEDRKTDMTQSLNVAINEAFQASLSFKSDLASKKLKALITEVTEHLVDQEYKAYWTLKPDEIKQKFADAHGLGNVETAYQTFFKEELLQANAALFLMLNHDLFFSGHAADTAAIKHLVTQKMMKKNTLPDQDTLESLLILRSAWDVVDIASYVLKGYKYAAKALQFLILLFGVVHPSVVVFSAPIDASGGITLVDGSVMSMTQFIIFVVSTVSAFVAAIMAFYGPLARWQQVRDVEHSMESAIWQFRTRTGPYACSQSGDSIDANEALLNAVVANRAKILGQANMQETSFYKKYPTSVYKHNQRAVPGVVPTPKVAPEDGPETDQQGDDIILDLENPKLSLQTALDNHFSPLKPCSYIRLRLLRMLAFYRVRLPGYSAFYDRCQFLIMAGAVTSATISYLGYANEVAIVSAVTAAISAWLEWASVGNKITRYNNSVVAIKDLILWWDSMSAIGQGSPQSVDMLVAIGEGIINGERGAWLSAPPAKDEDKEEKEDEEEAKNK